MGRARARASSEQGIALPVAVMLLFIILSLATAIAAQGIGAQNQSRRDRSVKRAVDSADAGIATATYRLNKLTPSELLCVVVGATGLTLEPVQSDGWCQAQTEDLGDGASYSY